MSNVIQYSEFGVRYSIFNRINFGFWISNLPSSRNEDSTDKLRIFSPVANVPPAQNDEFGFSYRNLKIILYHFNFGYFELYKEKRS